MTKMEDLQTLTDLLSKRGIEGKFQTMILSTVQAKRVRTEESIPMLIEALKTKELPTATHVLGEAYEISVKCGFVPLKVYH